jgi:hypothetical protein
VTIADPQWVMIEERMAVKICGVIFEAFPVEHSILSPAVGYISDCFCLWIDVNCDPRFFSSYRMTTAMQASNRSPRIKDVSWGKLEVEDKADPYKDAKLFPGGSCEWNWRETGTSHKPGIQIADVEELLEHGAKVVVLSRGMAECLHVPREPLEFLEQRQIAVHVLPTQHAGALYNKLAQTESVGGLFHTTC